MFPGGGCGHPLQYSRLENPRGQRSLAGYVRSMESQRAGHDWATKHSTAHRVFYLRIHFSHVRLQVFCFLLKIQMFIISGTSRDTRTKLFQVVEVQNGRQLLHFMKEENILSLTYNRFCGGQFLSFSLEYCSIIGTFFI